MSGEIEFTDQNGKRWLMPTWQSILIQSWSSVIEALGSADYEAAWQRTQVFFEDVAPPVVEHDCRAAYDKLKTEVNACATESVSYEAMVANFSSGMAILQEQLRPFLNRVKHSLFKNKYLEDRFLRVGAGEFKKLEETEDQP